MYKIEMNADVVFCFVFVSLQDYLKDRHNSLKEATVSRHDYYYDGRVLFLKKALLYSVLYSSTYSSYKGERSGREGERDKVKPQCLSIANKSFRCCQLGLNICDNYIKRLCVCV